MKNIFVYTMLLVLLKMLTGCSGTAFYPYGYSVHGNKVYYKKPFPQGTIEIEGADASSFKIVADGPDSTVSDSRYYATDKISVYYLGYKIPGSDGPSLKLLQVNYAKDKGRCYYTGTALPDADPATFAIKNDNFSSDKNHIYHRVSVLDDDASIFETFDSSSVVRTANTVSIYDKVVKLPSGASFKWIAFNFFAIDEQVFRWDNALPGAKLNDLTVLDDWYSKSSRHVYYGEKIIQNADPRSFQLLVPPYGRDTKHVFFFEKIVEGADPATFEIINDKFQCARDKYALYHEDKKIKDYTAADLANRKPCRQCNETSIYFEE